MIYKISKIVFACSAAICCILRVILKLTAVDPETGFYLESAGVLPTVFSAVFFISIVLLFVCSLMADKSITHTINFSTGLRQLSVLCGVGAIISAVTPILHMMDLMSLNALTLSETIYQAIAFILPAILSGAIFIYVGVKLKGDFFSIHVNAYLVLIILIWQVIVLLSTFMKYTILRSASDQMLVLLMMIFCVLFLLGLGRIHSGIDVQNGARQCVMFGLPFALCALSVSTGIIVAAIFRKDVSIALSTADCVFYYLLSIYCVYIVFSLKGKEIDS